jgi:hypothetical protein
MELTKFIQYTTKCTPTYNLTPSVHFLLKKSCVASNEYTTKCSLYLDWAHKNDICTFVSKGTFILLQLLINILQL